MDTSNFWWQGEAGPGPGPGPSPGLIGQSLRFRGAQALSRNFPTVAPQTHTFSVWLKLGELSATATQNHPNFYSIGELRSEIDNTNNGILKTYGGSGWINQNGGASYRDPSAWYHFVCQFDNGQCKQWMNGQPLQLDNPSAGFNPVTKDFVLGSEAAGLATPYNFTGYMAAVYFVESALEPTAFGRFNENGVWVPREVDFAPTALQYSDFVYGSASTTYDPNDKTKVFLGPPEASITYGPWRMFDGDLVDTACKTGTGGAQTWIYFRPETPLTNVSSLSVTASQTQAVRVNGVDQGLSNTSASAIVVPNPPSTVTEIAVQGNSISSATVLGITVNGKVLTNSNIWSADLFTSPNQPTPDATPTGKDFDGGAGNAALAFAQADNQACEVAAVGMWMSWLPAGGYKFTSSIAIHTLRSDTGSVTVRVTVDGVQTELTSPVSDTGYKWTYTGSGTLERIDIRNTSLPEGLYFISIDGQRLIDGQNPSYGANGFHLDFSDPSNLGKDVANGNDFTATGFNTDAPVAITGQYADPTQGSASGGAVGTGGASPAYLENIVPDNAYGTFGGTAGGWAKIFDGNLSSAPEWYGTQYSLNPLSVDFDLRDFTADGVTSVEICDTYGGANPRPYDVFLLDSSRTKIAGSDWTYDSSLDGKFQTVPVPPGSSPAFIRFSADNTQRILALAGIRVNGTFLSQSASSNPDYDLMQDSPTQNWATLNPLDVAQNISRTPNFEKANLSTNLGSQSGISLASASQFISDNTGVWYAEFSNVASGAWFVGIASEDNSLNADDTASPSLGASTTQTGLKSDGSTIARGVSTGGNWGAGASNGGTFGLKYDSATRRLTFLQDGNVVTYNNTNPDLDANNAWLLPSEWGDVRFVGANYTTNTGGFNFGQQPFLYQPAGTVALQTQNMPTPAILDGRDHFQAITGPGQGADSGTPGQLAGNWSADLTVDGGATFTQPVTNTFDGSTATSCETDIGNVNVTFAPKEDVVFANTLRVYSKFASYNFVEFNGSTIKPLTNGDWTDVVTSGGGTISKSSPLVMGGYNGGSVQWAAIEVDGKLLVDGNILAIAQQTFPNGLWWIKDRENSNQHQLVDSVRGGNLALQTPASGAETAYVAPAGSSVAWCWNAGGAAVTNNNGTIESQVAANTAAGFSIVSYNGNDTLGATVGHGLNNAPEFIIVKNSKEPAVRKWNVYHSAIGATQYLHLNTSDSQAASIDRWNNTEPTSTVFSLGDSGETNANSEFIAYCWHSVPGYSSFGSYQGNGNEDGPFIYTGHSVAWVMVKRADGSGSWTIVDAARDVHNPAGLSLSADVTNGESTNDQYSWIDFLSNGFKWRTNQASRNAAGAEYVYAAFASCPFQSPATAR